MSNYTKSTNFATKDNLSPGNPLKIVKGTEIDTEFNNIATAVATKTDNASAAITGGTIVGITDLAVADGGTGASTAANARTNLSAASSGANSDITSITGLTTALTVLQGGTGVTTSTGTGNVVLSNSPTLVTPALGTPSAAVLTNATGLPISTGVSGLGTGVATLLATPSSANLASAITDETGSGSLVFATSPTLVTPILGTPTSGTLTNATGLPISTGVSGLGTGVATFLGTPSSANLISAVTDETGTGSLVFATSPTLVTPALGTPSALVGTNITGTAAGLTAGNVTTNANLTGAITSTGNATSLGSFSSANLLGALTDETGTGSAVFATSPTLVTPILGTPTSATLTNATGLPLTTGVTGQLPVANGGTGTATPSIVAGTNVTVTGTWPNQTIAASAGGSGTVTSVAATVPSVFSVAGSPITTSGTLALTYSGTALPVANGGTGLTTTPANGALDIGNGTGFTRTTLTAGSNITITNASGAITIAASGGGSAAGSTTQLQYNNAGAFAGSANMTFDGTSLTLPNDAFIGGYRVGAGVNGNNTVFTPTSASTIITGTSYQNVAFGVYALTSQTATGYTNNTALGWAALRYNTTGVNNVAVGGSALTNNTTADYNTATGLNSLSSNTTGIQNCAAGYNSLTSVSTGSGNVGIGYRAGTDLTTGSSNVFIGSTVGRPCTTSNGGIWIGTCDASGTAAAYEIVIGGGTGKGASTGFINPNSGGVYQGNNSTLWSVTSDQRLKKNIVDNNIGLEKLTQIQVRNFEYRTEDEITELPTHSAIKKDGVQLGVIAQELQAVLPECVKTESTGVMSVDADNLTWYMINAIKELKAEFDAYKASHP